MINIAKDPKGYYIALGVDEDATADDIKSAFRAKAKRLHPDANPSPIAAKQFHRVREAYETLTDPVRRAAYDRGWRTVTGGAAGPSESAAHTASRAHEAPQPEPPPRTEEAPHPKNDQAKPDPPKRGRAGRAAAGDQPALCKCGRVTAQPRYIVFDQVWGRINRVQRKGVAGVYCRSCADKAAIRASMISWLAGWWAFPDGPRETVKAIVANMRGGRRPAERNARLLARQAKAFKARGEMDLARACAEQALGFAPNPELRRDIDNLLISLSAYSARTIKDRWREPGLAATVQALPLAALVGLLAMSITLSADRSLTATVTSWFAPSPVFEAAPASSAPSAGRIYAVLENGVILRTGPSADYTAIKTLAEDTLVLATETDPGGAWVRVVLMDRTSGFLPLSGLTPNIAVDALDALSAFDRPAPDPAEPVTAPE